MGKQRFDVLGDGLESTRTRGLTLPRSKTLNETECLLLRSKESRSRDAVGSDVPDFVRIHRVS